MRLLIVVVGLALFLQTAAAPPPPVLTATLAGTRADFVGGALHEATGLRPLWPWPVVCAASPCVVDLPPGAAVAVVAPSGEASEVVLVRRGWLVALPGVRG